MLWVTSLSLVLPPLQVVPMVLMFEVATSIYLLPQIWKQVEWKSITVLLIGTWIATPAGIYALASLPTHTDSYCPGAGGVRSGDSDSTRFCLEPNPGKPATVGVGLMAGLLNGSMGIVGPPVILFYFSSPIGVAVGRASIITYFIGTDSVGTVMFAGKVCYRPRSLAHSVVFASTPFGRLVG